LVGPWRFPDARPLPSEQLTELRQALRIRPYDAVVVQRVMFETRWMAGAWDGTACVAAIDDAKLVVRNASGAVFEFERSKDYANADPPDAPG
jgi:hypothetical protein